MCKLKYYSILFCLIMYILAPKNTVAGDCVIGGAFLDNLGRTELIIWGKVSAYHLETGTLDIEVLEVFRGTTGSLNIQILEDAMFGVDLTSFPVGTEWIFALEKFGTEGGYTISVCWINHLKVEPSVIGSFYSIYFDEQQRFSLNEFRTMLQDTYSPQQLTYDDGVQVGRQQCIDNPASCGIKVTWPEVSYEPKSGKLHIPAVNVPEASGNITIYEVILNQRLPSFVFDLDINSIKAHQ